jgi:hypothetical protein
MQEKQQKRVFTIEKTNSRCLARSESSRLPSSAPVQFRKLQSFLNSSVILSEVSTVGVGITSDFYSSITALHTYLTLLYTTEYQRR